MEATQETLAGNTKQKVRYFLRVLISILAFICLIKFGKIDLKVATKYLLQVNPLHFALAYFCYLITNSLAAIRFYFSSHALGFRKNYLQLLQLIFVGAFFNNFLPTTVGGDALRGYYLKKGSHVSTSKAAACIVYERYIGMIVLFWITSAAFILQDIGVISKSTWQVPQELAVFSHVCSIVTIFIIPFLPQINTLIFGKSNWLQRKVLEPVIVFWKDLKLITNVLFLSILLQVFVIICHFFIAQSLNIQIPFSYYLIFYPLTTLAGFMIPSLNGLGIREGAYIYFLKQVNIGTDQGLAFSICWLIILFITSVIGGLIYLFGDFRKHDLAHIPQS